MHRDLEPQNIKTSVGTNLSLSVAPSRGRNSARIDFERPAAAVAQRRTRGHPGLRKGAPGLPVSQGTTAEITGTNHTP
jgi:hypothetical protein